MIEIDERLKEFQNLDYSAYEAILRDPNKRPLLMEYFFSKTEALSRAYASIEETYKEQITELDSLRGDLVRIEQTIKSMFETPRLPSEKKKNSVY